MDRLAPRDKLAEVNNIRRLILTGAAGIIAAGTIALGVRTYLTNRRTQVSDRYAKAIAMVASDKVDERLGGIYALEHIMRESPADHEVIVEVLMAFIREYSARRLRPASPNVRKETPDSATPLTVATDIQAAIDVIGRRPKRPERLKLNFFDCVLPHANFERARIDHAIFNNCVLDGAVFEHASMKACHITRCRGTTVNFRATNLKSAVVNEATLTDCAFPGAHLSNASILHSDLADSNFAHSLASRIYFGNTTLRRTPLSTDWDQCRLADSEISGDVADDLMRLGYEAQRVTVVLEGGGDERRLSFRQYGIEISDRRRTDGTGGYAPGDV